MTGDPYKGTYIVPLSQRPPSNSTFLKAVLKYLQAKYNVHGYSRLIYKKKFYLWNNGILLNKHEKGGRGVGFDDTEITRTTLLLNTDTAYK